ncbi:MAG: TerC family protein [Pseudomonadota bacterium]
MADLFTIDSLFTLAMLIMLQAVLGFDNLLYISIESKRVPLHQQAQTRRLGIGIAIALRLILLFVLVQAVALFQDPLFDIQFAGLFEGSFSGHALIVLAGGIFILYTALKEIGHMMTIEDLDHEGEASSKRSMTSAIIWIVAMNLVFSFDSILGAMALTDKFILMAVAVVISGALMILLADYVAEFLKKNRMYEVLGLFILFVVGILLLSEGGHLAHLNLYGYPVEPMAKSTFYFVIAVMVLVEIVQSRYKMKLNRERKMQTAGSHTPDLG